MLKKFFIVIFLSLVSACSTVPIRAETSPSPSSGLPTPASTTSATSSPSPSVTSIPTDTLTPISTPTGIYTSSWPTQTPLPPTRRNQSLVLTQMDMMGENIGWGIDTTGHRLRTMDGGYTWQDVTPPEIGFFSAADGTHAREIIQTRISCDLIGCPWGWAPGLVAWRTSDGGQTWQRGAFFIGGAPVFRPLGMQFVSDATGWFLLVDQIGMSGFASESLFQTLDSGESWMLIYPLSNGCVSGGMIFVSEQEGWIGDDCRNLTNTLDGIALGDFLRGKAAPSLNRTTDGGSIWSSFPVPAPRVFPVNFTSSEIDPNTWFYCGIEQTDMISQEAFLLQWICNTDHSTSSAEVSYAYLTANRGEAWHAWLSTGNETFVNPSTGWRLLVEGSGQSNSLQQTIDGGLTWITIKTVTWQKAQFDFTSEQVGWAIVSDSAGSTLIHTMDGGRTWKEIKPVMAS